MKRIISTKDYYDDRGILLVAKGVSVTQRKIKELELLYEPENLNYSKFNLKSFFEETSTLKNRYKNLNDKAVNQASNILIEIIFNSKKQPWWIHINALGNYIDWLYSHSFDVAMIALIMGIELKYTNEVLYEIGLGAMLHDIGNLLVPKELLQRTDPLSEKETDLVRRHCELGKDSLAGCDLSKISTSIIIQHHERINGSGYPFRLEAKEITDYAKLVMVADAFDMLTAGRPYRQTKPLDDAMVYLKKKSSGFQLEYVKMLESILT